MEDLIKVHLKVEGKNEEIYQTSEHLNSLVVEWIKLNKTIVDYFSKT